MPVTYRKITYLRSSELKKISRGHYTVKSESGITVTIRGGIGQNLKKREWILIDDSNPEDIHRCLCWSLSDCLSVMEIWE